MCELLIKSFEGEVQKTEKNYETVVKRKLSRNFAMKSQTY